jgi:hypothetical protein
MIPCRNSNKISLSYSIMLQDQQFLLEKKINSSGAQSLSSRKKKGVAIYRMQQQQQSNKLDRQGK